MSAAPVANLDARAEAPGAARRRVAASILAAMVCADPAGDRPQQVAEAVALADMLETRLQTVSMRSSDPVARLISAGKRWRDLVGNDAVEARHQDRACSELLDALRAVAP